jgi:hypothetical protein
MTSAVDIIVVIPVGPTCKIKYILDTLDSICYYVHCSHKIIISDDSGNTIVNEKVKQKYPEVIILKTKKSYGKNLGLYVSLCNAYRYALSEFDFKALLRLDTDALIISHDPETAALNLFQKQPDVGLAGRIINGPVASDDFGNQLDNSNQRGKLVQVGKLFTRYYMKRPITNWRIRKILFNALYNEYEVGKMVFGGAYFFSYKGLKTLYDNGLLPAKGVIGSDFEEDLFFSMLISSVNLRLGDLATGDLPFGCAWKGLPASPHTLEHAGKKIIHSTRFWESLGEDDIRIYFQSRRNGGASRDNASITNYSS